jgi:hypothetical protein
MVYGGWHNRVICTNNDYKIVADHLCNRMLNDIYLRKGMYIFYKTVNYNPNTMTFNKLAASNFEWCYIKRSRKNLYTMWEYNIAKLLYSRLVFPIDYTEYKEILSKLSKYEIASEYKQVFNTSPLIKVKKWMVSDLLVKKQKNINNVH